MNKLTKIRSVVFSDVFAVFVLILLAIITHLNWFNPHSLFSYADFRYVYDELALTFHETYNTWLPQKSWGISNVQLYFYPIYLAWNVLTTLGLSAMNAIKITHFIPTAILFFVSPYVLIKHLTKSKLASFFGALFYGTTTHFIWRQQNHYTIAFVFAIAPLVLYFFMKALEGGGIFRKWLNFLLIYSIALIYEPRITYIITLILIAYFAVFYIKANELKKIWKPVIICLILLLGLHAYWILPALAGGTGSDISNIAQRNTIADSQFSVLRAITISDHSWTGKSLTTGFPQPVLTYLWIGPILALFVLIFIDKDAKHKKKIIFFSAIAVVGVFITKQNDQPYSMLFNNLREWIPGFILFRIASPFYFVTSLAYAVLIGYLFVVLKKIKPRLKRFTYLSVTSILLLTLVGANLTPVFKGDIKGTLTNYEIPNDYLSLKKHIISEPDPYRALWMPIKSRWGYTDAKHPAIDAREIFNIDSNSPVPELADYDNILKGMKDILTREYANYLLDSWSVKYVVLPQADGDVDSPDNYKRFLTSKDELESILDRQQYLKKVDLGLDNIVVYENFNYSSLFTSVENIFQVPKNSNFDSIFKYSKSHLQNFDITTSDIPNSPKIKTIFDHKNKDSVDSTNNRLIIDRSVRDLSYSYYDNTIRIYVAEIGELRNHGSVVKLDKADLIATIEANANDKYFLKLEGGIYYLEPTDAKSLVRIAEMDFSVANSLEIMYAKNEDNIFHQRPFDSTLWNGEVLDCSKKDENNGVSGEFVNHEGQSHFSLLGSSSTACVKLNADLQKGELLMHLPYTAKDDELAGFSIIPVKDKSISVYRTLLGSGKQDSATEIINLENYKGAIDFYLYDFTNEVSNTATLFGKPFVARANTIKKFDTPLLVTQYETFDEIKQGEIEFVEQVSKYPGDSKSFNNGSFESGLWEKNVRNCYPYDNNPNIKQSISDLHSEDGNHSLVLEAKRHAACTAQTIKLPQGRYEITFSYKSDKPAAGYFIGIYGTVKKHISQRLPSTSGEWRKVKIPLEVTDSDAKVRVVIDAYETDGENAGIVYYDNFQLERLPKYSGKFLLIHDTHLISGATHKTNFRNEFDKPTESSGVIEGCANKFIVINKRYSPAWMLSYSKDKSNQIKPAGRTISGLSFWRMPDEWARDCNVSKNLTITFNPQRLFHLGLIISSTTFTGCMGYLAYSWRKSRKNKKLSISKNENKKAKIGSKIKKVELKNTQLAKKPTPPHKPKRPKPLQF